MPVESRGQILKRIAGPADPPLQRELCECVLLHRPIRVAIPVRDLQRASTAIAALGLHHALGTQSFRLRVDRGMEHWSNQASACSDLADDAVRFFYVHKRGSVCEALRSADEADDDRALGTLLQYPPCCVEAFVAWQRYGAGADPVVGTPRTPAPDGVEEYDGTTPFSRYVGGGLVSHFLCAPNCGATRTAAWRSLDALASVFPSAGDYLVQLESSLILVQPGSGACAWRQYVHTGADVLVDASTLVGEGALCRSMRAVTRIEAGETTLTFLAGRKVASVIDRREGILSRAALGNRPTTARVTRPETSRWT